MRLTLLCIFAAGKTGGKSTRETGMALLARAIRVPCRLVLVWSCVDLLSEMGKMLHQQWVMRKESAGDGFVLFTADIRRSTRSSPRRAQPC